MKIHLLILSALCLTACANFTSINGLPAAIFNPVEHARVVSQIDQNKDKYITAAEIKASGVNPGTSIFFMPDAATDLPAEKYIENYDADYDQKLSPAEIRAYAYIGLFKKADLNKDGFWDKAELLKSNNGSATSEENVDFAMRLNDNNKDGKVSFEEFSNPGQGLSKEELEKAGLCYAQSSYPACKS